jgi:hypothetical protein
MLWLIEVEEELDKPSASSCAAASGMMHASMTNMELCVHDTAAAAAR